MYDRNEVLEDFKRGYEYLVKYLVDFYPIDNLEREFIFEFTDRSPVLFDWISGRIICSVKLIDKSYTITDEELKIGFSYLLQKQLRKSHMNNYELAKKIGVTDTMVSRYMTCKALPNMTVLFRIAKILNCEMDDLTPKMFIPIEK